MELLHVWCVRPQNIYSDRVQPYLNSNISSRSNSSSDKKSFGKSTQHNNSRFVFDLDSEFEEIKIVIYLFQCDGMLILYSFASVTRI
jgi:hypothetical protein